MNDIEIPEGQVNATGKVDPTSRHDVPVGDRLLPWHQGRQPAWKRDDYAEYVEVNGVYSLFSKRAHRIRIDLQTTFTNERRYHDWKGYDDIEPTASTTIWFNGRQVGVVRGFAHDLLRHLLQVERHIEDLRHKSPLNWWSDEEINGLVGRQVDYDGYPAVVIDVSGISSGEVTVYAPTWPDDGYDREGRLRTSIIYEKLNWYPDRDRTPVELPGGES